MNKNVSFLVVTCTGLGASQNMIEYIDCIWGKPNTHSATPNFFMPIFQSRFPLLIHHINNTLASLFGREVCKVCKVPGHFQKDWIPHIPLGNYHDFLVGDVGNIPKPFLMHPWESREGMYTLCLHLPDPYIICIGMGIIGSKRCFFLTYTLEN